MTSFSLRLAFVTGLLSLAACGGAQTTGAGASGSGNPIADGYELLGSVKIQNTADHAVIDVGSRGGQFGIAMITVDQTLDIGEIAITMGDGTKDSPPDVLRFDDKTKMHKFDLPGDSTMYPRKLEFRYLHMAAPEATVTLYAK